MSVNIIIIDKYLQCLIGNMKKNKILVFLFRFIKQELNFEHTSLNGIKIVLIY